MKCFCYGASESKWNKAIKKRKVKLGREIKVISKGVEKTFLTSMLFEKPVGLWLNEAGQYLSKESRQ